MSVVISLISTHTTYVISVFNCTRAEGLQVRRSAAMRTGRTPGLPPALALAKSTSWYIPEDFHRHQPSTPASQPRTRPGLCLREGGCGGKKKAKVTGKARQAREQPRRLPGGDGGLSAAAELGGGRPSTERRAPGGGHVRPARDPLKAGGVRPAVPYPHQGRKPRRRPHEGRPRPHAAPPGSLLVRADPVPVTDSEILGRHLGRQQHSRPQRRPRPEPRGLAPGCPRAAGPALRCWRGGGNGVRRRRPPGPRACCRRREETTPETPPLGPRRPRRVPDQALRRQPGLVAIAASRARRSVP